MGCCGGKSNGYQSLPSTNPLGMGINLSLGRLDAILKASDSSESIYYYVMTTIRRSSDTLQHTGSGPNWQGGIITLCTCKHYMRSLRNVNDWRGTWVAGFSTSSEPVGRNFLIYLMRIDKAFESHLSLWDELQPQAKATNTNQFGDVYRPLGRDTRDSPFNACSYHQPHQSHGRTYNWPEDIDYRQKKDNGKRAALLVGDKKHSFVWDKCKIVFEPGTIGRGHRTDNLRGFLRDHLRKAN